MKKQLPKNVRQIGNVSDSSKIYVEDYVDTFFGQISDQTEEIRGAFLIGEMEDRKSTRLNSSHMSESRMPSSA